MMDVMMMMTAMMVMKMGIIVLVTVAMILIATPTKKLLPLLMVLWMISMVTKSLI